MPAPQPAEHYGLSQITGHRSTGAHSAPVRGAEFPRPDPLLAGGSGTPGSGGSNRVSVSARKRHDGLAAASVDGHVASRPAGAVAASSFPAGLARRVPGPASAKHFTFVG